MIENILEKKVIDAFKATIGLENAQYFGAWQKANIKSLEDSSEVVIVVKVLPRQYDTPTIPDAQIQVQATLCVRADVDYSGEDYLSLTEKMTNVMQAWQKSFDNAQQAFDIEDAFQTTGFNLDGGDCGMDRDTIVWTFSQQFTIYGIVLD